MIDKITICCSEVSITGYDIVVLSSGAIKRYTEIDYPKLNGINSVDVTTIGGKTKAQEHALQVLTEYFRDYYRVKITEP